MEKGTDVDTTLIWNRHDQKHLLRPPNLTRHVAAGRIKCSDISGSYRAILAVFEPLVAWDLKACMCWLGIKLWLDSINHLHRIYRRTLRIVFSAADRTSGAIFSFFRYKIYSDVFIVVAFWCTCWRWDQHNLHAPTFIYNVTKNTQSGRYAINISRTKILPDSCVVLFTFLRILR